jgi:predicted RNase H-like nuclease (RuvC/YqgF family)
MRTPTTDLERDQLAHLYDPAKAHEYYEKHKHLKGRHKGSGQPPARRVAGQHNSAKAKQKQELQARITGLQKKLNELNQLIQMKEAALKRSQSSAKSNAKKNSQAKAKDKPKTAAEKAKAAREAKKFRKKHRQSLKTKAKQASNKSGGGSSKKAAANPKKASIAELKSLATKVRGQLAVAKQKLAAL